jgi:hypothetical protein
MKRTTEMAEGASIFADYASDSVLLASNSFGFLQSAQRLFNVI